MNNLLNSTEIATIFVDNDLNIKRYTERASQLIKLIPSDVGRHIGDLVSNLDGHTLIDDAREVLQTLVYKEKEVSSNTGKWYLMRIMPYRTAENVIDGLVITFVDINRIKQAESEARAFVMSIVDTLREPLLVLEPDLRVMMANHSFYRKFQTSASQTEGEMIFELGGGEWDVPDLRNLLDRILPENTTLNDYEVSAAFPRIGQRSFLLNARRLEQDTVLPGLILLALEEVIQ
jgi:PAS domain-containing protein